MKRDLGDFQTPPELAAAILRRLDAAGVHWSRVLEPTCGTGAFLRALLSGPRPPQELIGIEIQETHWKTAHALESTRPGTRVTVLRGSLFDLNLSTGLAWQGSGPLLVVGNPPWITAAELGRLESVNIPAKRNIKNLKGLDACTGASNFDIAEAVWLKLLTELADQRPTIALLCKTAVARAVLQHCQQQGLPVTAASLVEIDAARWFGAAVGAGLLCLTLGETFTLEAIPVFARLDAQTPVRMLGFHQGHLIADRAATARGRFAMGTCPLNWRQGVKHDAAAVMELSQRDSPGGAPAWFNKRGEEVRVESSHIYPLVKGSDLRKPPPARPRRGLIVTQHRIGQETATLANNAPRLWSYLVRHRAVFASRKSSIYRNQPPFALFGVGPYSFAPYKVAVSGLHRPARFQALGPGEGRPVMLDDTCYMLPCRTAVEAVLLTVLCNGPVMQELIQALSFPDAKRPVTKGLLQQIDLSAILLQADVRELIALGEVVLVEQLGRGADEAGQIADEAARLLQQLRSETSAPGHQGTLHGVCTDQLP